MAKDYYDKLGGFIEKLSHQFWILFNFAEIISVVVPCFQLANHGLYLTESFWTVRDSFNNQATSSVMTVALRNLSLFFGQLFSDQNWSQGRVN